MGVRLNQQQRQASLVYKQIKVSHSGADTCLGNSPAFIVCVGVCFEQVAKTLQTLPVEMDSAAPDPC